MTYRSSAILTGASAATAAVPVPAGATIGDIAVVGLYMESTAAVTPPAGFTNKVSLQTSAGTRGRLDVFWKRLTAADTGTYSFSWTGSTWRAAICGLWSGRVATGDPFDNFVLGTGSAESTIGVTTLNVSASPAAASGDALGMWTNFSTSTSWTPPTNYTERQDTAEMTLDTRDAIASGSTGNVTATAVTTDFEKAFLGVLAPAAGGGNSNPAGIATETDAAQPAGRIRITTGGVAAETDAAQPAGRIRATSATPAAEIDTALSAGSIRTTTAGAASETDAALSAGRIRTTAAGTALETDAALAAGSTGSTPAGQAAETDTAQPAGRIRVTAAGTALETDAGLSATRTRATVPGVATETDVAQAAARTRTTPASTALEADIALDAANPNAVIRDLELEAIIEPGRFHTEIEPGRFTSTVEPGRFRTELAS